MGWLRKKWTLDGRVKVCETKHTWGFWLLNLVHRIFRIVATHVCLLFILQRTNKKVDK